MSTAQSLLDNWTGPHPDDELLVLRNRPVRPDTHLAVTARFRDNIWRLGPVLLQQHCPHWQLNFTLIPARHRRVAKELFHTMLAGPFPMGNTRAVSPPSR